MGGIGIISDTHDNVKNVLKAVKLFKVHKVDFVVHCGDIVAPKTIRFFKGLKMKFVRGNCDGDSEMITEICNEEGHEYLGEVGEIELNEKHIGAYHGHNQSVIEEMIRSKRYDYILTGHTHKKTIERFDQTVMINPGGHYFGDEGTIAILNYKNGDIRFIKLR
ncbi:MAG: metallophosphoesterase [Candidatus Woesearchaeota archaeon]